jgi:hypothetical protein
VGGHSSCFIKPRLSDQDHHPEACAETVQMVPDSCFTEPAEIRLGKTYPGYQNTESEIKRGAGIKYEFTCGGSGIHYGFVWLNIPT